MVSIAGPRAGCFIRNGRSLINPLWGLPRWLAVGMGRMRKDLSDFRHASYLMAEGKDEMWIPNKKVLSSSMRPPSWKNPPVSWNSSSSPPAPSNTTARNPPTPPPPSPPTRRCPQALEKARHAVCRSQTALRILTSAGRSRPPVTNLPEWVGKRMVAESRRSAAGRCQVRQGPGQSRGTSACGGAGGNVGGAPGRVGGLAGMLTVDVIRLVSNGLRQRPAGLGKSTGAAIGIWNLHHRAGHPMRWGVISTNKSHEYDPHDNQSLRQLRLLEHT